MAGKQRGFERGNGSRSSLLWECERAIECKRPKYLLMENVKALTQKKFSKDFRRWQLTLQGFGYTNYTQVLDSSHYGVPQHRERVFMVSVLNNTKPFYFPTPFPLEKRLKDVLEDEVDEKYYLSDSRVQGMLKSTEKQQDRGNGFKFEPADVDGVAHTLTTKQNRKTDNFLKVINPLKGKTDKSWLFEQQVYDENGIARAIKSESGSGNVPKIIQRGRGANKGGIYEICPTITTSFFEQNNHVIQVVQICPNTDSMIAEPSIILEHGGMNVSQEKRIYSTEGISCTINTSCPGRPKIGEHGEAYRIRRITPREAFRLMDVDEESIDKMMGAGISNSQLYRLAGNSIVVSTIYHVFRKMFIDTDAEGINPQLQLF